MLYLQVGKREEAIHKLKIEKLALQEQQQKAEDNVSVLFLLASFWSVANLSLMLIYCQEDRWGKRRNSSPDRGFFICHFGVRFGIHFGV